MLWLIIFSGIILFSLAVIFSPDSKVLQMLVLCLLFTFWPLTQALLLNTLQAGQIAAFTLLEVFGAYVLLNVLYGICRMCPFDIKIIDKLEDRIYWLLGGLSF